MEGEIKFYDNNEDGPQDSSPKLVPSKSLMKKSVIAIGVAVILIIGIQIIRMSSGSSQLAKQTDQLAEQKAEVMNFMTTAWSNSLYCKSDKKDILSGSGGDKVCDGAVASYNTLPQIKYCGSSPENTKWVVTNGRSSNWSIELNCKDFTYCNGKANAYCNVDGCVFGKNCDYRKK